MRRLITLAVLLVGAFCITVAAQESGKSEAKAADAKASESKPEAKPLAYCRLDLTVNELEDGKKINSRSYTTTVRTEGPGPRAILKVGSRVPVTDTKNGFTYMDVGVNIEMYNLAERDGVLVFDMNGDVSSLASADQPSTTAERIAQQGLPPVLRQARFAGPAAVVPGKQTVLYTLDDVNSKHRFQIEVLATKLK